MTSRGYDKTRFKSTNCQKFICKVCNGVAIDPYECQKCAKMFCKECLEFFLSKNPGTKCPSLTCTEKVNPIVVSLKKFYNSLELKCSNPKCDRIMQISDIRDHEMKCFQVKCWNHRICERGSTKETISGTPSCSEACAVLFRLNESFGDIKKMYEILEDYRPAMQIMEKKTPHQSKEVFSYTGSSMIWLTNKCGIGMQITMEGTKIFLKESFYLFRTAIASIGFKEGIHYWEIVADNRTENELKIGVTCSAEFDLNSAFCDHEFGFAYYGLGQIRHNSNAAGPAYGLKFKKEGTLGCLLNMNKGTLSFALNGEFMGIAFTDQRLRAGPIYPAVSLLHCAGCQIVYSSTKLVPNCFVPVL